MVKEIHFMVEFIHRKQKIKLEKQYRLNTTLVEENIMECSTENIHSSQRKKCRSIVKD